MSEARRLARSLVEPEALEVESLFPRAESIERLRNATRHLSSQLDLERVTIVAPRARYEAHWEDGSGVARLVGEFRPEPRSRRILTGLSIGMTLLLVASAWLIAETDAGAARFLVPLFTGLATLALPFVAIGMASVNDADRARIRKTLRVALREESERLSRAHDP